jgi:2-polyprenyl-3-methyl-5-hydroxy-6-metoxy-1,4-benzoquinol methylase
MRGISQKTPTDENAVRWAYRIALGREPESDAVVRAHCRRAPTLADLRRSFLNSEEFRLGRTAVSRAPQTGMEPPLAIDRADRSDLRDRLFRHIASGWSHYGETEPHWSVLTFDEYRSEQLGEHLDAFNESGAITIKRFLATLDRNGLVLPPNAQCVELGCGVGRLTRWLAPHVGAVTALDVSPGHLDLARQHVGRHAQNVDFRQLRRLEDLDALPVADVFFTFLVLQHNPPPVIEAILDRIFARLAPGAIAFFHLPTYIPGYRFDLDAYFSDREGHLDMEMHALPQKDVFRVAARHDMEAFEVLHETNELNMVASYYLMRKRPVA